MLVSVKVLCRDCKEPFLILGEGGAAAHYYCACCGNMVALDKKGDRPSLLV